MCPIYWNLIFYSIDISVAKYISHIETMIMGNINLEKQKNKIYLE